ncbi:hypothetical protein [Acinetobacter nosocomialis]|uniref:hypothetical protein n=1 Tax=Acinetobacter nosocomialis TaxID=106654 RepID=UPI0033BF24D4
MTVKITNPYIRYLLEHGGFKVKTGSYEDNRNVCKILFDLGFTWPDGTQELPEKNYAGLSFLTNQDDGFIYAFNSLIDFDERLERKETTYRALIGLLHGEGVVSENNGRHSTHKAMKIEGYYLITDAATYYWDTGIQHWMQTINGISDLINLALVPVDPSLKPAFFDHLPNEAPSEIEQYKPQTVFEETW